MRYLLVERHNQQCALLEVVAFSLNSVPRPMPFEDVASMALAIRQLNEGDGSIVPELEGLNERCNVRFTLELRNAQYGSRFTRDHCTSH